eukprot:PhF_6_TR14934/c0_g1_i1/m.23372
MATNVPTSPTQPQLPVDPAESLFEPTGNLEKDYCAYCEIENLMQRDDILDSIQMEETPTDEPKVRTNLFIRNSDSPITRKDMSPLANAIPHCPNLFMVRFTNCNFTEHSYKLLVDAVYRSPSVYSVSVDFNPGSLTKDNTVMKKDRVDYLLWPQTARGGHTQAPAEETVQDKKAEKKGAAKPPPKGQAQAPVVPEVSKQPIPIPPGWHSILLTALQDLSLRGNGINDKQAALIAQQCEGHLDLVSLSLWGNNITDVGATSFATLLRKTKKLTALNLGSNKLSDAGAISIANALLTADVSLEESVAIRNCMKVYHPPGVIPEETPQYPTYAEIRGLLLSEASGDPKKDAKKPPPKGKGAGQEIVERPKAPWDCDCVRMEKLGKVRVPGNTSLWYINLEKNQLLTDAAIDAFVSALGSKQPPTDDPKFMGEEIPPQFINPYIPLEHILLDGDITTQEAQQRLVDTLQQYIQHRTSHPLPEAVEQPPAPPAKK